MAPALTKILKNAHGIHLSSPPASTTVDSDGRGAMCSIDPGTRPDDGDLQKIWLNLSSFGSLDSCLPSSLLDSPVANPMLSPCLQTSVSRREAEMSLPSPGSLVNLLSSNKSQADSHQVASVFPGVPDMFLVPVPEHKSQEACLLHGYSAALECGPDGGDVHHSSLTLSSVCPLYSHGEIQFQGYTPLLATPPTLTQENVAAENCPQASLEPCINRVNFLQLASKAALEEAAKEQLYRHAELQGRAWRLRRRLQVLLGEHALCHCSQQLEGLKKHYQLGNVPLDSLDSIRHGELPSQVDRKPHFSWPESLSSYTEVREFSRSSQMVLRGLQEALDSEATASSSSDEEPEEMIHGKTSPLWVPNTQLYAFPLQYRNSTNWLSGMYCLFKNIFFPFVEHGRVGLLDSVANAEENNFSSFAVVSLPNYFLSWISRLHPWSPVKTWALLKLKASRKYTEVGSHTASQLRTVSTEKWCQDGVNWKKWLWRR